jgi:hypothetical protein
MAEKMSHSLEAEPRQVSSGKCEHVERDPKLPKANKINQRNTEMYEEALLRYPTDDAIDKEEEKRLKRKLDSRILISIGICYLFYASSPFTLNKMAC